MAWNVATVKLDVPLRHPLVQPSHIPARSPVRFSNRSAVCFAKSAESTNNNHSHPKMRVAATAISVLPLPVGALMRPRWDIASVSTASCW